MNKGLRALGRLKAGTMNKTEAAYAALLEAQKAAGPVRLTEKYQDKESLELLMDEIERDDPAEALH